jgi:hypothetical protein
MTDAVETVARGRHLASVAIFVIAIIAGSTQLFALLWDRQPFEELSRQPGGVLGALAMFAGGAMLHEALHAAGWKTFARVAWTDLSLQRSRRKLGLIMRLAVPARASAYRMGLILPALVIGIGPIVLGLTRGLGLFVLWGCVFFFESVSDLAIFLAVRSVPSDALLVELAGRAGCRLVPHPPENIGDFPR